MSKHQPYIHQLVFAATVALMAAAFWLSAPARAAEADAVFGRAMRYFFLGDSYTSRDMLNQNIAEHPDHTLSYSGLAFIHEMGLLDPLYDGDITAARALLDKALRLGPDNKWNHLALAVDAASRYITGDMAAILEVEKQAKAASRLSPESGEPYLFLWFVNKFIRGDAAAARKDYGALTRNGFEFANAHFMLHYAESFFGTCDAAVAEAHIAVIEAPATRAWYIDWDKPFNAGVTVIARCDCLFWKAEILDWRNGTPREKEALLRESLDLCPGFISAPDRLASLLISDNRIDEAEALLAANYNKNPNNAGAALALADFHANSRPDMELLKSLLTRFPVIPDGPYAPEYYNRLAGYFEKAGQPEIAARFRAKAGEAQKFRKIDR